MASILVVCTGNVCRSPLAEGFLRASLQSTLGDDAPSVASAGTSGWEGSGAQPNSVAAAAERGIDISSHRARALDLREVEDATLIVTMEAGHRHAVARLVPEAAGRTFTLKELVRLLESQSAEPTDPSGPAHDRGPVEWLAARIRHANAARGGEGPGAGEGEDVMDPLGMSFDTYRGIARELEEWCDRLARALSGRSVPFGAGGS